MSIKKIEIHNFKIFRNLNFEFGNFNVLIGANASGKSNFVQIFKFLNDITHHDLDIAIAKQGGNTFFTNLCKDRGDKKSNIFSLKIIDDQIKQQITRRKKDEYFGIAIGLVEYNFEFDVNKYKILKDELNLSCGLFLLESKEGNKFKEKEKLGGFQLNINHSSGEIRHNIIKSKDSKIADEIIYHFFPLLESKLESSLPYPDKSLLLEISYYLTFTPEPLLDYFSWNSAVFDFDPKLSKETLKFSEVGELDEGGKNLAIVLERIQKNANNKRKFYNLLKNILPFVDSIEIEHFAATSLMLNLKENYPNFQKIPAALLSDGTINIIALIIALYFTNKPIVVIEEPEKNVHPSLISKIIEMCKDASKNKQIIITTHNPEVVKHAGLNNLYLVKRDINGFSNITKPSDKNDVKAFLRDDIGIDELYVKNLLS